MTGQTRAKILDTGLAMFNALGEPNVTTNHLADELGISAGNLYYHFRNKDAIVAQLFADFEARMDQALARPHHRLPTLEDVWLHLHRVFECMWAYRFLYRDLVDILSRNRKLKQRFARMLGRASQGAGTVMRGLADAKILSATPDELHAASENVLLVATFWFNYNAVRSGKTEPTQADLTQGIYQVMLLIAPFMREAERVHLNALVQAYRR